MSRSEVVPLPGRWFTSVLIPAALLLAIQDPAAGADELTRLGSATPAYATSSMGYDAIAIGDNVVLRGRLADFENALSGLPTGSVEYTWEASLTVTQVSLWDYGNPPYLGGLAFDVAGGHLVVVQDDTPDADFSQAGTFGDGTILLEVTALQGNFNPGKGGHYLDGEVTGGTLAGSLAHAEGAAPRIALQRDFVPIPYDFNHVPPELASLGYWGDAASTLFALIPVPTEIQTWSRIKTLF